ncbi:hypothetical protein [Tenacibaculum maritimum]|uniref:hypothetical protein n=2 Tax=Tenacibaculum maritimum TaxID=107401 RepID=UPI0012E45ADD|nr:hypothetical protein [Tenacibaculum maritimum]CAA0216126.1 conserved hypothetical protein [Tenacibaculum maritimum]
MKKKILLALFTGVVIYSVKKVNDLKKIFHSLIVDITNIHNVNINLESISLLLDFTIRNPTNFDFGIKTFQLLKITEIQFFNTNNNSYIGSAKMNISNIVILKKQSIEIKNISIKTPINKLLNNLDVFSGNLENIKIVLVFDSLGKQFKLTT